MNIAYYTSSFSEGSQVINEIKELVSNTRLKKTFYMSHQELSVMYLLLSAIS